VILRIRISRDGLDLFDYTLDEEFNALRESGEEVVESAYSMSIFHRVFSNPKRVEMLYYMIERNGCRFNEFVRAMDMNPRMVKHNLDIMARLGLIELRDSLYKATNLGAVLLAMNLAMTSVVEDRRRGGWRKIPVE